MKLRDDHEKTCRDPGDPEAEKANPSGRGSKLKRSASSDPLSGARRRIPVTSTSWWNWRGPSASIKLAGLQNYLSDELGEKVDLVTISALKPRIKENILSEVVYI